MEYLKISFLTVFLVLFFSILISTSVGGKRNLSKEGVDDIQIETQLRDLNKKPVKTIITEVGDVIDCIDMYKQPAFDNSLLKDHKIQSVFAEESISIPRKKYYGGSASMSIHNLTVDPDQFSTSQIWIANVSSPEINGIQTGIMKNPSVVGGNLPRLFGFWINANGHQVDGCYNMACQGFIQIHPHIFIDQPFLRPSVYGEISYDIHIRVYQAPVTGHWWLRMGAAAEISEDVGYWPNELFTLLRNTASAVRYGGYVGSMTRASTPPMGNGFLPHFQNYDTTAYMRLMKYVNEEGEDVDLDPYSVQTIPGTVPQCYNIMYAGQIGEEWENTIVYGGPGGFCN